MKENDVNDDSFDMQIVIASGLRDISKVTAGLAFALSLASWGSRVVVFLTMEGAAFANEEEGKIKYIDRFESVQNYFDLLLEENARIEVCTSCAENYCITKKIKNKKVIRDGLHFASLSTASIRSLSTKTIVF